ncbi:LPS translocon maturation chaperone LptM [Parashewanella tropica]|uniref:LPS translocon maturation chaperone LptM n=1 Tax=Parashewanella tropica TaxID=2547970 RepID=UPI0010595160|nr:lipoprotein [Parashewanella tropica]
MKPMMLMLLACLCLSGCGQKGPLYQTPTPETNKASAQQQTDVDQAQSAPSITN